MAGEEVVLTFQGKTQDCRGDDMTVSLLNHRKTSALNIPQRWYREQSFEGNVPTSCQLESGERFPAFLLNDQYLLLFLRSDDRPSLDRMSLALIDAPSGKVLDFKEIGMSLKETTGLLKTDRGIRLQLIKTYHASMQCDCDAAYEDAWMEVFVENKKIVTRWQ
jgi:hypothetical protein